MQRSSAPKLSSLVALFHKRSFTQLEPLLSLFLRENPGNMDALNLLGLTKKEKGHVLQANPIFTSLCETYPKNPAFLSNLANLAQMQGDSKKAISCLKRALKLEPDDSLLERILHTLGMAQKVLGHRGESLKAFQTGLSLNGALKIEFQIEIANLLRADKKYPEAIEALEGVDVKLSRTHQLECIYKTNNSLLFDKKVKGLLADKKSNPLLGALITHSNATLGTAYKNPFCKNPLNYVFKGKIPDNKLTDELLYDLIKFSLNPSGDFHHQALLINGKQSNGNLLKSGLSFVDPLKEILMASINHYRKNFAQHRDGFLREWPNDFEIYAWLVNIMDGGQLKSHIHKEGWLSGSLYLQIPKPTVGNEGAISFSLNGADFPTHGVNFREMFIPVVERDIVMFPSSLFHKTIPFTNKIRRISLAFDIIPTEAERFV